MDLKTASKKLGIFSTVLSYLGATALALMMILTTIDVAGRYIFNKPITGAYEMTEYLVLILIFSFLAVTQAQGGHVSVDILTSRLPSKVRFAVDLFNHLACLVLMGIICWMGLLKALESKAVIESSPNLGIPKYPFVFFLALGCLILCIEYLRNILNLFANRKEDGQL